MAKTVKQRIINRLNKGFSFELSENDPSYHHGGRGYFGGGWSWGISHGSYDIGSMHPMTECLKWKRWIFDRDLHEIFMYVPAFAEKYAKNPDILIENKGE